MNIDLLLAHSENWLQYAIRLNLLGEKKEDLTELKGKLLRDEKICSLLNDVSNYHSTVVSSHRNPNLPIHKLLFLLDLGLDRSVPEINNAIEEILKHKDNHGVYQSFVNVPKHFGGSGEDTFGWALCDAPLLLYALLESAVDYDRYIKQGTEYLASLFQNGAYPCVVSGEFGKFRGPGRKDDPCPYATLIILKLFSEIPEYKDSDLTNTAVETLLALWENSRTSHPYMFFMGSDFRKLKAPSNWYDIISVMDVISRFDAPKKDARFLEMLSVIRSKQDKDGFLTPESVYQAFKGWDFGQKKVPSPYLTYLCERIFKRIG